MERKPWQRMDGETSKAYKAFMTYLKMPVETRTMAATSKALGHSSQATVEKWASRFDWRERAASYEEKAEITAIELVESSRKEVQQQVIQSLSVQLVALDDIINTQLNEIRERQQTGIQVEVVEIKRIVEAINQKDTMARRLVGLPTTYNNERAEDTAEEEAVYIISG